MKQLNFFFIFLLLSIASFGQEGNWFYATMSAESAQVLKNENPDGIQILTTKGNESAVYVEENVAAKLKNSEDLHGPRYIFRRNKELAVSTVDKDIQKKYNTLNFTITEEEYVNKCLEQVNENKIGATILELEAYGTRFHTQPSGLQAALDIKDNWQEIVENAKRTDVSVALYDHQSTLQKSVIVTIPGSESPNEIVIIGGHLDSGDITQPILAPGADDNASGIATLTETLRILMSQNFRPLKTVQIMGYAAEEVGLVGSNEIAQKYSSEKKNVLAVAQFDLTNYKGSSFDVALMSDFTSNELNEYLIDLLDYYNASGNHIITYEYSACGYACSDHASWNEFGYSASFPTEAKFSEVNPNIHTPNDTFEAMNNDASHSAKFVKLALEFVIEVAKIDDKTMSTTEFSNSNLKIVVKNRDLIYYIDNLNSKIWSLTILDLVGRRVINKSNLESSGSISLQEIPNGFYIAVFRDMNGRVFTKKFLIR